MQQVTEINWYPLKALPMLLPGLATLLIGLAAAVAGWGVLTADSGWLDDLERQWADQLRRIRISTSRLRIYLICWLCIAAAVGILLWVGMGSPLFAACAIGLLLSVPWVILRKLAARRHEKIEDQLADAMVALSSAIRAGLSLPQSLDVRFKGADASGLSVSPADS